MILSEVLSHLCPGAEWSINDESYDTLIWHSDGSQPSLQECENAWQEIKTLVALRPVRYKRDKLLSDCDWTQIPDAPVDAKAWALYRQELRDLPANTKDPRHPVWPIVPS